MALLINVNRSVNAIKPKNGTDFTLEELRKYIGCSVIEIIRIGNGNILVVDDEGALNGSVLNKRVSIMLGNPIFGNAVYCKDSEVK